MKKTISIILIFTLLLISGCAASTPGEDSSADSKENISTEESDEESTEESSELIEDSSADESIEKNEIIDVSEDSTEVSEPEPDISEDESSIEPPAEDVSKPDEDISEPAEDVSKPSEDISKPAENTEPAECVHEYTVSQKKAPTCAEDGVEETYCKYCKFVKTSTGIQSLGHSWGEWAVTKEATSTNEGSKQRTCFRCGKREIEIIPKVEEAEISFTKADADYIANEFLRILNEKRAELGRQPLVTAPIAHQMATERAVQISEYFSHNLPNGDNASYEMYAKYMYNPEREGIPYGSGENIAGSDIPMYALEDYSKQYALDLATEDAINRFERSYGHWYDLTNERYTACGVGVYITLEERSGLTWYTAYICVMTMDKLYGTDAA